MDLVTFSSNTGLNINLTRTEITKKEKRKETRNVAIPRKPDFPSAAAIKNMDQGR